MRKAAIAIGSNSLRMLVADIHDHQIWRVCRDRMGMRMFAALDQNRAISTEMIQTAVEHLSAFQKEAIALGADEVSLYATSAVRDCTNQQAFADEILRHTGMNLEIITGEEEANLGYSGVVGDEKAGLIDIGGGSTEIIVGNHSQIEHSVSLQLGAVRLFQQIPISSAADALKAIDLCLEIISRCQREFSENEDRNWYGTGGTLTMASAFVQHISIEDRDKINGHVITADEIMNGICELAPMPMEKRLHLAYLRPQRADIAVHGLAILFACMQALNLSGICVDERGNLEGYLKKKYLTDEMNRR